MKLSKKNKRKVQVSTHPPENPVLECLIVFTRYPEMGKVKTRLIPFLGSEGAAELQRCMTEDTIGQALKLRKRPFLSVEVHFEGGSKDLMKRWLGTDVLYRPQKNGDLGKRMFIAFKEVFQSGIKYAVVTGSDCPELSTDLLNTAFCMLRKCDAVLGPARDGGYYLIGFRDDGFWPEVFEDIDWGTDKVLTKTRNILEKANRRVHLLEEKNDVDTLDDLNDLFHKREKKDFCFSKTISYLTKEKKLI